MRETPNIKLTQFEPNDVPNWLDQYNSDMLKVDTAVGEEKTENSKYELRFTADEELINNNRTQINENTQNIANVKDDIKNIKGGSTTSIAGLQTEVALVSQSLTTLKGGSDRTVAELETDLNTDKSKISTLEDGITNIETKLGNETLHTNKKTLTGAINEIFATFFMIVTDATIIRKNDNELTIRVTLRNNKTLSDFGIKNNTTLCGTPVSLFNNDTQNRVNCFSTFTPQITDNTAKTFDLNYTTKDTLTDNNFYITAPFIAFSI